MTVLVFNDGGIGSRAVHKMVCDHLGDLIPEDAVWGSSTYYGTKSPDRKLTAKELLSIICPHIFVGHARVIVNLKTRRQTSLEPIKIGSFAGMLCGRLERAHLLKLAQIVRRKRQKIGRVGRILQMSIYDCIPDSSKSIEQCQDEIAFCDGFIRQYVSFRVVSSSSMRVNPAGKVEPEKSTAADLS